MDDTSYDIPPEVQAQNDEAAMAHQQEHLPAAQAYIALTNPNSSGKDRLSAANVLKNYAGSDDARPFDAIKAALHLNLLDVYKALTGGADQRIPAYDSNGNQYFKVYNQRTTALNPQGELRRIEDMNGNPLSTEDVQKIGPVTSLAEVPMHDRPFFQANQITAKDAATAQAKNWNSLQDKAASGVLAAPNLKALTQDNKQLLDKLLPYSVNPKTRELLAGVNDLRTGNQQDFQSKAAGIMEFINGDKTSKDFENFKKTNGGFTFGLNYGEGKGLIDSNGKVLTNDQVKKNIDEASAANSSNNAVSARKQDLLAKAQLEAFGGNLDAFNAYQRLLNNEEQKANLINGIEAKGGIGIAKPNIPLQSGDSFSLAKTKNEMDDAYADLLSHFSKTVLGAQKNLNGRTPGIGEIEGAIANNPVVNQRKQALYQTVADIEKQSTPINAQISSQNVNPALLSTPTLNQTNPGASIRPVATVPNRPMANPTQPVITAPVVNKKPMRSLLEIGKKYEVR